MWAITIFEDRVTCKRGKRSRTYKNMMKAIQALCPNGHIGRGFNIYTKTFYIEAK